MCGLECFYVWWSLGTRYISARQRFCAWLTPHRERRTKKTLQMWADQLTTTSWAIVMIHQPDTKSFAGYTCYANYLKYAMFYILYLHTKSSLDVRAKHRNSPQNRQVSPTVRPPAEHRCRLRSWRWPAAKRIDACRQSSRRPQRPHQCQTSVWIVITCSKKKCENNWARVGLINWTCSGGKSKTPPPTAIKSAAPCMFYNKTRSRTSGWCTSRAINLD